MAEIDVPEVNVRSEVLMQELWAHMREVKADHPTEPACQNERLLFEGWAIQKIAGLQLQVMQLALRLEALVPHDEDDPADPINEAVVRFAAGARITKEL